MTSRGHIPLKVQLAAALLGQRDAYNGPVIPHEHAKLMSEDQIISLFQLHHYPIRKAEGGSDHPSNLMFLFRAEHLSLTRTRDVPEIAKNKRLDAEHREFRRRMLAKAPGERRKAKGTIRSKGFDKTKTKKFNGKVVERRR